MQFHFLVAQSSPAMVDDVHIALQPLLQLITSYLVAAGEATIGKMWFRLATNVIIKKLIALLKRLVGVCARFHVNPLVRHGEFLELVVRMRAGSHI
jgi:hypothetical protein